MLVLVLLRVPVQVSCIGSVIGTTTDISIGLGVDTCTGIGSGRSTSTGNYVGLFAIVPVLRRFR